MKSFGVLLLSLALVSVEAAAQADVYQITVYTGYSDGQRVLLEGRITQARPQTEASTSDSSRQNLKRNLRQFFNKEGEGWPLTLSIGGLQFQTRTDSEGYFRLDAKVNEGLREGWQPVFAKTTLPSKNAASSKVKPAFGKGRLLVLPAENTRGLISDIDDTILVSEVLSKRRLLKNTFLKNSKQRQAVPGMAELYAKVVGQNPKPEAAPLFYLSGSPRQLYGALTQFLAHNHFPPGVLLTKRISRDRASDAWLDPMAYKTKKMEEIFEYFPQVRFILVGDDGEKDPEIYEEIRKRYPQRIEAIWIRHVHTDKARARFEKQLDLAEVLENYLSNH